MKKFCNKCQTEKDISEFQGCKKEKDGKSYQCRRCAKEYYEKRKERLKDIEYDIRLEKECYCCRRHKILDNFRKDYKGRLGRVERCKECCNNIEKDKYHNDKDYHQNRLASGKKYNQSEKGRKTQKEYNQLESTKQRNREREKQPEVKRKRAEYRKTQARKDTINKYNKKKRNTPQGKLRDSISASLNTKLKRRLSGKCGKSTFDILNFTIEEYEDRLESLWIEDMSWDNFGDGGWEADHIIAESKFKYSKPGDKDLALCWTLENFQPMWASDNRSKGNKNFGQWLEENPDMMERYGENYKKFLQFLDKNPEYKPYYYD